MGDAPNLDGKLLPRSMWPPVPSKRSNLPMLYYSLVVVGTAALLLALYNLIIVKWCAQSHLDRSAQRQDQLVEVTPGGSPGPRGQNQEFLASFKYKKGSTDAQDKESDYECPVCLSAFEEGEEECCPSASTLSMAPA